MSNRFEELATKAVAAGLAPATPQQVDCYWKTLGVTRQTAWNWRNGRQPVPLTARLAAAWLMHCAGSATDHSGGDRG